jgi:hypothetical protein
MENDESTGRPENDESTENEGGLASVDAAVGGLLSWVTGKDSIKGGGSPTGNALGELVSWVSGKGGKKNRKRAQ